MSLIILVTKDCYNINNNKGFAYRMYKELSQTSCKKANMPVGKWVKNTDNSGRRCFEWPLSLLNFTQPYWASENTN